MFDEQPDGDPHGECAAEIHRLQAVLSELVEAQDALTRANIAFNERLRTTKFFTFTVPSPEALRVEAAWSAARLAVAAPAALPPPPQAGVDAHSVNTKCVAHQKAANPIDNAAALPPPPHRESQPDDDEIEALAMQCCGDLRADRLCMTHDQRINFARRVIAAAVPHREVEDSMGRDGVTPPVEVQQRENDRFAFQQALYAWREARAVTGAEFRAVMALYDRLTAGVPAAGGRQCEYALGICARPECAGQCRAKAAADGVAEAPRA